MFFSAGHARGAATEHPTEVSGASGALSAYPGGRCGSCGDADDGRGDDSVDDGLALCGRPHASVGFDAGCCFAVALVFSGTRALFSRVLAWRGLALCGLRGRWFPPSFPSPPGRLAWEREKHVFMKGVQKPHCTVAMSGRTGQQKEPRILTQRLRNFAAIG